MTANTTTQTDLLTGEVKKVNVGFAQIYDAWWPIQRSLISENPTALRVFTWLAEIADKRNGVVVSYPAMSIAIGLHKRTLMRAVKHLVDKKIVTVLKSGNTNVYYLNDRIIWKDTANKKDRYSKFSAEVYIVASEQEPGFRSHLIGHAVEKNLKKPR